MKIWNILTDTVTNAATTSSFATMIEQNFVVNAEDILGYYCCGLFVCFSLFFYSSWPLLFLVVVFSVCACDRYRLLES